MASHPVLSAAVCAPLQITDLRHKLADAQKALGEQEVEREQKQRDFDRKLLLAKSRIEVEEVSPAGAVDGPPLPGGALGLEPRLPIVALAHLSWTTELPAARSRSRGATGLGCV